MLYLKSNVRFGTNALAMALAAIVINEIFKSHGFDCTITSANDSQHGPASLHSKDGAFDIRSKIIPDKVKDIMLSELKERLDKQYDILLEGRNTDNEHFHVEYDPK